MKYLLILISLCIAQTLCAQSVFYKSGTIKYERVTNAFRLTEGSWLNRNFDKNRIVHDTFQLLFNETHSLYNSPSYNEDEELENARFWSSNVAPSKSNIVYKTLKGDSFWAMRDLFEDRLTISDTIRKPQWKITGETRDIAGFLCHKAVTVLYDSLYVVAFYTDQIVPQSGPETWGGLPGMILGLAVPRLYTTWMAYSFENNTPTFSMPKLPKRKKKIYSWNSYYTQISERFNDWGNFYKTMMVWMWSM